MDPKKWLVSQKTTGIYTKKWMSSFLLSTHDIPLNLSIKLLAGLKFVNHYLFVVSFNVLLYILEFIQTILYMTNCQTYLPP